MGKLRQKVGRAFGPAVVALALGLVSACRANVETEAAELDTTKEAIGCVGCDASTTDATAAVDGGDFIDASSGVDAGEAITDSGFDVAYIPDASTPPGDSGLGYDDAGIPEYVDSGTSGGGDSGSSPPPLDASAPVADAGSSSPQSVPGANTTTPPAANPPPPTTIAPVAIDGTNFGDDDCAMGHRSMPAPTPFVLGLVLAAAALHRRRRS